jgi:pimeloyl-ACP methyl ester carboxylesterase
LELTPEEIDATRASTTPSWATRIAAAHTLPASAERKKTGCTSRASSTPSRTPTLLLAGSDSPADLSKATYAAAEAIPDTRIHVLERHGHMAHKTDPAMVAAIVRQFILS